LLEHDYALGSAKRKGEHHLRNLVLLLGPIVALIVGLAVGNVSGPAAGWAAGITTLCAVWWIFQPIPIPATSMIPLASFPLLGILPAKEVADFYGNALILLLMGCFMLSTAMERSGAHRRLALGMVNLFGGAGGKSLVFGFMAASAFLSMWISNTATVLMLLPIVLAVTEGMDDHKLKLALILGIAYAGSVGGIGTPIGTPPNLIMLQIYRETTGIEPTFSQWMGWALPVVIIMVPLIGLWLTRNIGQAKPIDLPETGAWRPEEVRTLTVFGLTALAWMTRREPFGGWSEWLNLPTANDASVAMLAVVVMFLVPNGRGGQLLSWERAGNIPWGCLLYTSDAADDPTRAGLRSHRASPTLTPPHSPD